MAVKFSDWITEKYVEWRGNEVKNHSVTDFANYLGVTQPTLSNWMSGSVPREQEKITRLVNRFGPVVYDVLGLPHPNAIPLDQLPQEFSDRLQSAVSEVNSELSSRGLKGNSSEAFEIVKEIFERHGFQYTVRSRR